MFPTCQTLSGRQVGDSRQRLSKGSQSPASPRSGNSFPKLTNAGREHPKAFQQETPRRYEAVPRALVAKILDAQGSTFTSSIGEGVFFNKTLKIGESPIYHSFPLTLPQSEVDSPPMRADNLIAFPCIINTTTK